MSANFSPKYLLASYSAATRPCRLPIRAMCWSPRIHISVQPQGKIITNIDALRRRKIAGRHCALFCNYESQPDAVLYSGRDQAALDYVNVARRRFATYLRRMSAHTQYIAITHRRGTMEEADVLDGVTMQEGRFQLLQLRASEVEKNRAS